MRMVEPSWSTTAVEVAPAVVDHGLLDTVVAGDHRRPAVLVDVVRATPVRAGLAQDASFVVVLVHERRDAVGIDHPAQQGLAVPHVVELSGVAPGGGDGGRRGALEGHAAPVVCRHRLDVAA